MQTIGSDLKETLFSLWEHQINIFFLMYTFPQGEVFCTVKGFKIVPWSSIIKEYGGCGQGNCRAHLVAMFIVD